MGAPGRPLTRILPTMRNVGSGVGCWWVGSSEWVVSGEWVWLVSCEIALDEGVGIGVVVAGVEALKKGVWW